MIVTVQVVTFPGRYYPRRLNCTVWGIYKYLISVIILELLSFCVINVCVYTFSEVGTLLAEVRVGPMLLIVLI